MSQPQVNQPNSQPSPGAPPPQRPRWRWRFRTGLIWAVAAALLAAWILHSIEPVVTWADVMNQLGVRNKPRYTRLCVLGILLCAVVAGVKALRTDRTDDL